MIKQVIPGIGQGCCVEQIAYYNCRKQYRILYDCGSVNLNLLKNYIDNIDADVPTTLVISHLHFDHISGIPYLINHFKKRNQKIKRLFLPYSNIEFLIFFFISIIVNNTYENADERDQLLNIIRSFQNSENNEYFDEVIFVIPNSSKEETK